MRNRGHVTLVAICLLVACKPAAEASPATSAPAAKSVQHEAAATPAERTHASPKGITKDYFSCLGSAEGTIGKAQCMSAEATRQDTRLNSLYKKLLASLDKDNKELLVLAQREWLVLRDRDGAFEASLFGNSQMENLSTNERDLFYTCERADRLQDWLDIVSQE